MVDKSEHNFVADAHNWEQRIKTENGAAQIWTNNWGTLYAEGQSKDYNGKIADLQKELSSTQSQPMATNTMLSYLGDKPFVEPTWQNYGKKTFGKFESFGPEEKLDPAFDPGNKKG